MYVYAENIGKLYCTKPLKTLYLIWKYSSKNRNHFSFLMILVNPTVIFLWVYKWSLKKKRHEAFSLEAAKELNAFLCFYFSEHCWWLCKKSKMLDLRGLLGPTRLRRLKKIKIGYITIPTFAYDRKFSIYFLSLKPKVHTNRLMRPCVSCDSCILCGFYC